MHSATGTLFFFIRVNSAGKSRGQLKEKSQRFCRDVRADWHCRIFKQTRDLQKISLSRAPYGLAEQIGYMFGSKHG